MTKARGGSAKRSGHGRAPKRRPIAGAEKGSPASPLPPNKYVVGVVERPKPPATLPFPEAPAPDYSGVPVDIEAESRYTVAVPAATPLRTFKETLEDSAAPWVLPPRNPCEDCGAKPGERHASLCFYHAWPVRFADDAEYRPALATALREKENDPRHCLTCGGGPIYGWSGASSLLHPDRPDTPAFIEWDRKHHRWWCGYWAVHPGVTPF